MVRKYGNHPLVKYVRSLEQELYLPREVADMLDCSIPMLDFLRRRGTDPLGPTHHASYGGIAMHLYSPERIEQIREYLQTDSTIARGGPRRGPPQLWTRTEQTERSHDHNRAHNYRRRALAARAAGDLKEAQRLEKLETEVRAQLAKAKAERRAKMRGSTE